MEKQNAFIRPPRELSEGDLYLLAKQYLDTVQRLQMAARCDITQTPTPERIAAVLRVEVAVLPQISEYAESVLPYADLADIEANATELLSDAGKTIRPQV